MTGVDLPTLLKRIKALMFMDDLALLADSLAKLQSSLNRTSYSTSDVGRVSSINFTLVLIRVLWITYTSARDNVYHGLS